MGIWPFFTGSQEFKQASPQHFQLRPVVCQAVKDFPFAAFFFPGLGNDHFRTLQKQNGILIVGLRQGFGAQDFPLAEHPVSQ